MIVALAALALGQTAPEPQATITDLAFDPARLFEAPGNDLVQIQYRGDDYAYPVYAIALRRQCPGERGACRSTLMARLVRAPNALKVERPRWAGQALIGAIVKSGAKTRDQIADALDKAKLGFLEADISTCPTAKAVMPQAATMQWVPLAVTDPDGPPAMEMALHADTMTVRFASSYTRLSTYTGIIDDRAPSGWAVRLAAALEPCWRPADATPPWRRVIPPLPAKRVTDLPPP